MRSKDFFILISVLIFFFSVLAIFQSCSNAQTYPPQTKLPKEAVKVIGMTELDRDGTMVYYCEGASGALLYIVVAKDNTSVSVTH